MYCFLCTIKFFHCVFLIDNTPLDREGEATDIANTIDLLVDERAGFLLGIDILCDGGAIANLKKVRAKG